MFKANNIMPHPLREMPAARQSEVWGRELSFEKGQHTLILADSGKGKSTLLHILYKLRNDFDGTALIDGQVIANLEEPQMALYRQKRISIVFQDLRLFADLTAWENLMLKNDLTKHKTDAEIKEMAELLGVSAFLNQNAGTLSYGQRQRFAIIRALCQPFEMLLLDEPFSHLDANNSSTAAQLIRKECAAQGAGSILVSLGENYGLTFDQVLKL